MQTFAKKTVLKRKNCTEKSIDRKEKSMHQMSSR
jgi:hypothetical protein